MERISKVFLGIVAEPRLHGSLTKAEKPLLTFFLELVLPLGLDYNKKNPTMPAHSPRTGIRPGIDNLGLNQDPKNNGARMGFVYRMG